MRRHAPFQRAGLLLAGILLGLPAVRASGLPAEDLRQLLLRGFPEEVILAIVEEEGPPPLSPAAWLELRDLGASDRLLLALLPPKRAATAPPAASEPAVEPPAASEHRVEPPAASEHRVEPPAASEHRVETTAASDEGAEAPVASSPGVEPPAPAEDGGPGFRAFYDHDPEVGRIFVVTNLDPDGEPMAGADSRMPNRVTSPEPPPPPPPVETAAPPAPSPPEVLETAVLPVATATSPAAFVGVSPYYGFFFPYPTSHLYPPGSYTHNKLFHLSGSRGFSHYQLPAGQVFYLPPFPGAGSHPPGFR